MSRAWWLTAWIVLLLAAAAGVFARFDGLGQRPLAVDEYYFVKGVHAILQHGVPALPGGGYYGRGPFAQYASALSVWAFGGHDLALRLPATLFSLATCALVYVYARPRLGRLLAGTCSVLLLVSSWEIEFARFARMYSPFQFMTLCFLWSVDRVFFEPRWRHRYLPHALAVLATLTHSLGVLLLPLLMLPLALPSPPAAFPSRKRRFSYAAVTAAVALATAYVARFDFRNWGVRDALPQDFVRPSGGVLRVPEFPFWSVSAEPILNLALLCAAITAGSLGLGAWRARGRRLDAELAVCGALVVAAVLHSLLIAAACAAILVLRFGVLKAPSRHRPALACLGLGAGLAVAWLGLAVLDRQELVALSGGSLPGVLRRAFFGWPDFYAPLAVPWIRELPVLGAGIAAACGFQLLTTLRLPLPEFLRNPAVVLLYFFVVFGVLESHYDSTRYTFFLYPLGLVVLALSLGEATRWLGGRLPRGLPIPADALASGLALAFFAAAGDFNPRHISAVAGPEASFRIGRFEPYAGTWYQRSDYPAAAVWVEREAGGDRDARIVVVGLPPVSYYLPSEHAVYYDRADPRFAAVSRERGTRDLWSQRRLLSTPEELREHTTGARRVFLVRSTHAEQQAFVPETVWGTQVRESSRRFRTVDGRVEVVSVELAGMGEPR